MQILESERIYLRNFATSDVNAIFSYRSLNEVALYQYWHPYTRKQALKFISQNKNSDFNILNKWNGFAVINNFFSDGYKRIAVFLFLWFFRE